MSAPMGEHPRAVALAGLARLCEPPVSALVGAFVDSLGAEAAWRAIIHRQVPDEILRALAPRLGDEPRALVARAREDLRRAAAVGADIIGPGDDDWPAESFAPLQWVPPYEQCGHAWSPLALYRRGGAVPTQPRGTVAIVGSRAATPYGARIAADMAADAVDAGCTVASGAAFGIDAAAHRGALHGDTPRGAAAGAVPTLAVLACGIDRAYPIAHRALIDTIGVDGAVVTEYPPGSVPARHRFLVRNRLIAALAEVTVVVEAGRRSGSLNTATTAANLGRGVAAVPGPITSAMSSGCHDLIRDGKAVLVASWPDVRGLMGPLTPSEAPRHGAGGRLDGLDLVSSRVHDALPARGGALVEVIAAEAALPVADVMGALAVLHTEGLARKKDGLWCRTAAR